MVGDIHYEEYVNTFDSLSLEDTTDVEESMANLTMANYTRDEMECALILIDLPEHAEPDNVQIQMDQEQEEGAVGGVPAGDEMLNNENHVGDDNARLQEMASALPPEVAVARPPVSILVFGDSFVKRMNVYLTHRYGSYHNYNLHFNVAEVHTYGIGGMTTHQALRHHMSVFENLRPTIVYIQLGSNDLSNHLAPMRWIVANFRRLCRQLVNIGVERILIGQVFMRMGDGIPVYVTNYNDLVMDLNHDVWEDLAATNLPVYCWRHDGLWLSQFNLMDDDGIHLNDRGINRYFRSVRGSLLLALSSLPQA